MFSVQLHLLQSRLIQFGPFELQVGLKHWLRLRLQPKLKLQFELVIQQLIIIRLLELILMVKLIIMLELKLEQEQLGQLIPVRQLKEHQQQHLITFKLGLEQVIQV